MPMLPVQQHAARILDQVDGNRVTIIIGATGCGKSTQIPKMLRSHLKGRVLCVQPRRMATVAVASRVAEELREPLGGLVVGYHIGAACLALIDRTEILFVTAGIFLEQLKAHGAAALAHFAVVVIDEVHERSCENDLGLACLVQLAASAKELRSLRIVLMSATADVRRYSKFMRPLCEQGQLPGKVALGESAMVYNVKRRYLKDAVNMAGYSSQPLSVFEELDRASADAVVELMALLTRRLVLGDEEGDDGMDDGIDDGSTVLHFVPTMTMIEGLHRLLEHMLPGVPLYVLHSSVDIDDCMAALMGEDGAPARVVLASAVAESSITIKKVTHVIDSCRSCEIHWDPTSALSKPHIVETSKAQATQRAGRTGRTNDGIVWQLVAPSSYHNFDDFEVASMQLQLMRKEVLLLTCATSKQLTDAKKVLQGCLDPPKEQAVERAEQYLLSKMLIERQAQQTLSKRSGKTLALQPTLLGRLIDSMPLDIEASTLVILGAFLGLLEEAVLLAVLRCQQPMVIKREPNKRLEYEGLLAIYGPKAQGSRDEAFAEDELLANLAAVTSFQAWQADPRRLRRARKGAVASGPEGDRVRLVGLKARPELNGLMIEVGAFDELRSRYAVRLESGEKILVRRINLAEPEAEWCRARGLSHTALLAVLRTVEHVLQTLFRWHPPLLQRHQTRQFTLVRNAQQCPREVERLPGKLFWLFFGERDERLLRKLLQTMRTPTGGHREPGMADVARCFFLERGCCTVRNCSFDHGVARQAQAVDTRPLCKFALVGKCRFGASCRFRHPDTEPAKNDDPEVAMLQEQVQAGLGSQMPHFVKADMVGAVADGDFPNCYGAPQYIQPESNLLLIGEGDFSFAACLSALSKQPSNAQRDGSRPIIATSIKTEADVLQAHPTSAAQSIAKLRGNGVTTMFGVDACRIDDLRMPQFQTAPTCIVWNMPFAGVEQLEPNQLLIRAFFCSAVRCAESWGIAPTVHITVGINQFADRGILAAAQDAFLKLDAVHHFDPASYQGYTPRRNDRDDPFEVGGAEIRTYAFSLQLARVHAADEALHEEEVASKRTFVGAQGEAAEYLY